MRHEMPQCVGDDPKEVAAIYIDLILMTQKHNSLLRFQKSIRDEVMAHRDHLEKEKG